MTAKTNTRVKEILKYCVKYVIPFILGALSIILVISAKIENEIAKYNIIEFKYDVDTQIYTMNYDKEDLKPTELGKCLAIYSSFDKKLLDQDVEEKIVRIKEEYQKVIGGVN